MTLNKRILLAVVVLVVIAGAVLGIGALRCRTVASIKVSGPITLSPGSVPIYLDGQLVGGFGPDDLEQLEQVSFVDAEKGKTQECWLLSDVLGLHINVDGLTPEAAIVVSSSSRTKSANLTWAQVSDPDNRVLLALSANRGTLKLVSSLEGLDTRDKWIQDVDKIEVSTK